MKTIKIVDLTPINRYAHGDPIFKGFSTSFPSRNVRALSMERDTPEEALADATRALKEYEAADIYGNMGEVIGVTRTASGKYAGVLNTYHSNT